MAVGLFLLLRGDGEAGSTDGSAGVTGADFHSLVADPVTPGRLFVGGHEAVSVSDDGGVSWHRLTALDDVDAMGWGFSDAGLWLSGHPGIVRSPDGGRSATAMNGALPDTDIHAFGAGAGELVAAGPNVGVIVSTDDGASWEPRSSEFGRSLFGQVLIDPDSPDRLLAADAASGPVMSVDGGRTWRVLAEFPATWVTAAPGWQLIVASSPDGAVASRDGGTTWAPIRVPAGASIIEADPHTPGRIYAGVHGNEGVTVSVSDDGGGSWHPPSEASAG